VIHKAEIFSGKGKALSAEKGRINSSEGSEPKVDSISTLE
jgi:hypothetical protein